MRNNQPFYHRCSGAVTFTANQPITEQEFVKALGRALKPLGLVEHTLEVESVPGEGGVLFPGWEEPEPGDPADLL